MIVADAVCWVWQIFGFENRGKICQILKDNICILYYLVLSLCLYPSPAQLRPIEAVFDKVQSRCRDNNVRISCYEDSA